MFYILHHSSLFGHNLYMFWTQHTNRQQCQCHEDFNYILARKLKGFTWMGLDDMVEVSRRCSCSLLPPAIHLIFRQSAWFSSGCREHWCLCDTFLGLKMKMMTHMWKFTWFGWWLPTFTPIQLTWATSTVHNHHRHLLLCWPPLAECVM